MNYNDNENAEVKLPEAAESLGGKFMKNPCPQTPPPKPSIEETRKSADMAGLMAKVETTHQGTGPGWNSKRPKGGK